MSLIFVGTKENQYVGRIIDVCDIQLALQRTGRGHYENLWRRFVKSLEMSGDIILEVLALAYWTSHVKMSTS